MIKISNQEAAVLGILYEHHHYAPRIEEIMVKRGMGEWADIKFPSILHILKKLEENKLVEIKSRNNDDPSRKVYYITDNGKLVLNQKIKSILSKKEKIINPFDLGLANIHILQPDEIIKSLKLYLKTIEERIQYLEHSIKVQEENNIPYNFISISSRSIPVLKAEKMWIKEFMDEIEVQVK